MFALFVCVAYTVCVACVAQVETVEARLEEVDSQNGMLMSKIGRKKGLLQKQKAMLAGILEDRERLVEQVEELREVVELNESGATFVPPTPSRPLATRRESFAADVSPIHAAEAARKEHKEQVGGKDQVGGSEQVGGSKQVGDSVQVGGKDATHQQSLLQQNKALKTLLRSLVLNDLEPHPLHRRARARSNDSALERITRRTVSNRGKVRRKKKSSVLQPVSRGRQKPNRQQADALWQLLLAGD